MPKLPVQVDGRPPATTTPRDMAERADDAQPPLEMPPLVAVAVAAVAVAGEGNGDSAGKSRPPRALRTPASAAASPVQKRRAGGKSARPERSHIHSQSNTPTLPPLPPVAGEAGAAAASDAARMLSDSQSEREIAEFGRVLDDMLARVTCRELVKQTADYMAAFPHHSVRFQLKMKQRALSDATRQFQAKLMLFYVLHEFLKSFRGDALLAIQREWFQTVDDILHACVRDLRSNDDGRKRLFKTLARWEELKLYPQKIKGWKSLVMGEVKPRRAPVRLPKNDSERQMEAPDQLQQFPPPLGLPQVQIDRTNYPLVFEREDFASKYDLKQHWRFSAVAFVDVLAQCLGLSREITLTAAVFFHRVFDRGMYARERFKFAAACIFLAAKAASKRMKLVRMVRTMHDILETPLLTGDEEILELERMQLLHYEIEVLKAINFDLTIEMPFYYLRRTLEQMPDDFRNDISQDAQAVLEELFWTPECLSTSSRFLAEAAAYIASRNHDRVFDFRWCHEDEQGETFTERNAKDIMKHYRLLAEWKKGQQSHFDSLVRSAGERSLGDVFKVQHGGLRLDTTLLQVEEEYTEKGKNESKDRVIVRLIGNEDSTPARPSGTDRPRRNDASAQNATSQKRRRDNPSDHRPIKQEHDSQRTSREADRSYTSGRGRSRDREYHTERDRYSSSSRSHSANDGGGTRASDSYGKYDSKYATSASRRSEERRESRDSSRDRSYQSDQRWDDKYSRRGRDKDQGYDHERARGRSRDRNYNRSYDDRERSYDGRDRYYDRGDEYASRRYDDRDRYDNYDDHRGAREYDKHDKYDDRYDRDRGRAGDREYDYSRGSRSPSSSEAPAARKTSKKKRKRVYSRSPSSSRSPSRSTRSDAREDDRRPSRSNSGDDRRNGAGRSSRAGGGSVQIKDERAGN